ncbi:MAG: IPT/TIG domain-containing protein [Ignavibacteriaceae bacterium]
MKNNFYNLLFTNLFIALIALLSFNGCSDKGAPSLFQGVPTTPIGATPVISSINPPNSSLAGVSQLTITGKNFSTNPMEDLVYFNISQAVVVSATTNQLVVTAPNITGDSISIMVAVLHSELFSNKLYYSLTPVAKDIYPDSKSTYVVPVTLVSDNSGNIYTSLTVNNSGAGVREITPDSTITNYASYNYATFWSSMRFGPGGELYTAGGSKPGIFYIPAGGGAPKVFLSIPSSKISQLEFDANNNLWAGGNNNVIYRVKQDKNITTFPFIANITAMRVYNDGGTSYLYVAAQQDSNLTVQRFPIDANGDLGTPQLYYDFSGNYGSGNSITSLEFSADGDMYLGTNLPQAIVVVHKDKSSSFLYPGILSATGAVSMVWGNGNFLYYVRAQTFDANAAVVIPETIVKLDLQKPGAPYYGR